jgi:membrane protein involved in colicin uptake
MDQLSLQRQTVDQKYAEAKKASEDVLAQDKKDLDTAARDAQKAEDDRSRQATKDNDDAKRAAEKDAQDAYKAQLTEEQNAAKAQYKAMTDLLNYNQQQEAANFKTSWDARFKSFADSEAAYKQVQIDAQKAWLEALVTMKNEARAALGGAVANDSANNPILTARALGGTAWAGQEYIVGENGPERFRPNVTGSIISNGRQATGSSGGNTYNITYQRTTQEEDNAVRDVRLLQALEANL